MADAGSLRALVEARRGEIKAIAARHHGRSIALFVSVARKEETESSDLDFLVEFDPGTRPFQILKLGVDLEEALCVRVNVATVELLRPEIRDAVVAESIPL